MTVLIAYSRARGSTREIAERVASRMSPALGIVECRTVEEVVVVIGGRFGDLRDWDAVDSWTDGITKQLTGTAASAS